ncbi:Branched-chain amino acid transport protein [Peptostreptococcus russellii]|uniref:Branched-chain amino acid transport protein n=1 Tax=Peptostreptococcus russellii TaxID=215200 RepID=A0A1H8H5E6_9FIRM|nr:AzlD domain-containing protein [Peptostreptococcus russellii]SEN51194.1 Branched-chain amino acid transport protein [Peptostreptococcus russellii]
MSSTFLKLGIIFLSFIGMYLMRYIPFALLGEKGTSKEFERFIKYIPIGVFVALTVKDVFFKDGRMFLSLENIRLLPALLIIAISVKFRNIGVSVISGGIIILISMFLTGKI